jgi:PAS domain S-box-containing protein
MKQSATRTSEQDPLAFLAGGGEMGERTRGFDWSKTPVGPVAEWPQSLKTAVRIMLDARYPMFVWWGPGLINLYNDAYAPFLGQRHPNALGRPAAEVWAEIWHIVGPQAEAARTEGRATWSEEQLLVMERNGFLEETWFTWSYSPIHDDEGGIGGVFCACREDTHRVLVQRRLVTLRALADQTAQAKTVEGACEAAAATLAENRNDLPFALLYLLDDNGQRARLAALTGLVADTAASPMIVELGDPISPWPFRQAAQTGKAVAVPELTARFGPLPAGVFPEPPQQAVVVPMARPGLAQSAGFVVAGVSPRLVFNDDYQGFLDLLAGHIATAVANARAYEEERKRAEALAELDRAKTAFFSNVSHEFRTPLTLMLGPLEDALSETDGQLPPEKRERLEIALRNGVRLQKLVNTLLDFSRIEAGRVRATFEPTDLAAFTAELASNFRSACEKAGLELKVDCPPLAEPVLVDRQMWEKVVLNLLSNAFKFTFAGEIAITLRQVDSSAELRVRDTGTGIPAAELPRLFERFHRIENARGRTHEGSGIGLALVQELVKLHGGVITVESEDGIGTTFTVTIPLGSKHLPPKRIGEGRKPTALGAGAIPYVQEVLRWLPDDPRQRVELPFDESLPTIEAGRVESSDRPRILVADDNTDMRQYVARLLAERYHTEVVADGEAALQAARERAPDLILADVMMPRLDGFGLLKALRADPRTRHQPVLLLSARAGEESRVEGMEAGADDYLVKPFSGRELLARVGAHLQMARMRKEANEALRQSHDRFAALFDAAPVGMYLVDSDLRIRQVNPRARPIFADIENLIGSDFVKVIHRLWPHHQADEIVKRFRHTLATGEPYFDPERIRERPDRGESEYHEWQIHRIALPDGRYGVVCYFSDITRHVRARMELAESEAKVRRSEERMRLLWEAAAVLLTTDDPDTMLRQLFARIGPHLKLDTYFNFMVNESRTGLRLASCIGISEEAARSIETLSFGQAVCGTVALQRRPLVASRIQQSSDPKVQLIKSFGIRAYACNPLLAGDELLGTLSFASRSRDQFGEDELDFLRTICRYVAAAYERLHLIRQLQEGDRRKDEFLATLAHELRNPLAPLRNGLQVMKLARNNGDAVEQSRAMMERQLGQMVRLIDDLLDLSRISRGKVELRTERIELAQVVQQAIETSRPAIEEGDHHLTISVPPGPIFVDGDLTRLAQVFANLLNNAARYTERGGRIALTVERQGGEAVVSVKDNGVGIPVHMLPRVFDMFTQVDRSLERAQGGLGIGLSLVKKLVEMHGGRVEARSDGPLASPESSARSGSDRERGLPDAPHRAGSEFVVHLPVVLSVAGDGKPETDDETRKDATWRRRILVADDNRDSATSLALLLRIMGNETQTAHDGVDALAVAEAFRPDVILLDIGMPRLNGYETARRIREEPWGRNVVLVAQTGWGQEDDKRQAKEAGFNFHMVKPVDPGALEKLLAGLQAGTG